MLIITSGTQHIQASVLIKTTSRLRRWQRYAWRITIKNFDSVARENDNFVSGFFFNFGRGISREQAATAILAKKIPLVVAGSFGNIFSPNSINNGLMGVEAPKLVQRLGETFSATATKGCDGSYRTI